MSLLLWRIRSIFIRMALLNFNVVFRKLCSTLRNRGLHDVGHVGAATGRGAKPRQAILKGAARTSRHLPSSGAIWLFRLTRRQSRRRCARDVTLLASVPLRSSVLLIPKESPVSTLRAAKYLMGNNKYNNSYINSFYLN